MELSSQQKKFIEELKSFLRIPSISADPAYKDGVRQAALWTKEALENAGCQKAEIIETNGHPIVFGQVEVEEQFPTVLVYGHYDVQPPDPLDLWENPPFDPVIKSTSLHPDGALFARGACDDKGQVFMHIKALEILLAQKTLPCNIKFMIEGEEEVGSNHLEEFVRNNKEKLASDAILISDTGMIAQDIPSITTGLRGLSYMEVCVTGPNRDLHSGLYGGAVPNPINILCEMIAKLTNEEGKITIPGFYDEVVNLSDSDRQKLAQAPFDEIAFKKDIGLLKTQGEKGFSTEERRSIRPTLDVNGIWGGYTGEGAKTVIPSEAFAKISMRLVPHQQWEKISVLFESYFKQLAPKSVSVSVTTHHGGMAYVTPTNSIAYAAAKAAYEESFGITPVPHRGGGSIPIVPMFEKELGIKSILMGFGLDSDAIHSPNEHFGLFNFFKGIETISLFYKHFALLKKTEKIKV
tara:strand:- start:1109 stop:2500 length:1392 start_codon:yes stop_codon:yes gene_type:complete